MNVHLFLVLLAWLGTVYFLFDKTWQHGDVDFSAMLTTRRREDNKNESKYLRWIPPRREEPNLGPCGGRIIKASEFATRIDRKQNTEKSGRGK
jgi:hypothetical protein